MTDILLRYCRACSRCAANGLFLCEWPPHTSCDQALFMEMPHTERQRSFRYNDPPASWLNVPLGLLVVFYRAILVGIALGIVLGGVLMTVCSPTPVVGTPARADSLAEPVVLGDADPRSHLGEPNVVAARATSDDIEASRIDAAQYSRAELERIITGAATGFDVDAWQMIALAECESTMRHDAVGDAGASVGLFQFKTATWKSNAEFAGYDPTKDERHDPVASAAVAASKIAREANYSGWQNCRERLGLP